mgnify:CR=1 FL=1
MARCGLRVRNACLPAHLFGKRKEGRWQAEPSQRGASKNCSLINCASCFSLELLCPLSLLLAPQTVDVLCSIQPLSVTTQVKSSCAQPPHLSMTDSLACLWLHAVICCHDNDCNVCHTGTASTHGAERLVTCRSHGMMSAREITL